MSYWQLRNIPDTIQHPLMQVLKTHPDLLTMSSVELTALATEKRLEAQRLIQQATVCDREALAIEQYCKLRHQVQSQAPQQQLTTQEFIEQYCHNCGSQRCEGIGTEWFEGCAHKQDLKPQEVPNESMD